VRVATSPAFLEAVANDPAVLPAVASKGRGKFDLSAIWPECIGLEFDTGGWVLHRAAPGVYDAHTLFLPKSVNVREKAREALAYLFGLDAVLVIGRVPADLPHARRFVRDMGMTYSHDLDVTIQRESGPVAVHEYHLTREAWESQQTELTNGA
jgi:hypothetical protein